MNNFLRCALLASACGVAWGCLGVALAGEPTDPGRRSGPLVTVHMRQPNQGAATQESIGQGSSLARSGLVAPDQSRSSGVRTERVSVSSAGVQGNDFSAGFEIGISGTGRFAAFASNATNLVPDDTNGVSDAFVHDRRSGQTTRVSVGFDGSQANGSIGADDAVTISADGRIVVFASSATNLVQGDTTSGLQDLFAYDRRTGKTERVTVSSDEVPANSGVSFQPSLSADGWFVVFVSTATNLVDGDTNNADDVFVRDRKRGTTERINVSSTGIQSNAESFNTVGISGDGRFVVFVSPADTLVPGDTPGTWDLFVRDRRRGTTERLSTGVDFPGNPSISATGRFLAFWGADAMPGGFLTGIFIHDRLTGSTKLLTPSGTSDAPFDCGCDAPVVAADGRTVAFFSFAPNLVPGDTNEVSDIFVADAVTGKIRRVSVGKGGVQGNGDSFGSFPEISADGRVVAFGSGATNLVEGDTNGTGDAFVHALSSGR